MPPAQIIPGTLVGVDDLAPTLERERAFVTRMARAELSVAKTGQTGPSGAAAHVLLRGGGELVLPLAGIVDVARERERVSTELAQLEKQLTALEGRLANAGFIAKAKPDVVAAERKKADEWRARRDQLSAKLRALGNA